MKRILFCCLVGVNFLTLNKIQAESLLRNGNFDQQRAAWDGKGKIAQLNDAGEESPKGNQALVIDADQHDEVAFWQNFRVPKNTKSIKISFRVKAASDFQSDKAATGAIRISIMHGRGSTFQNEGIKTEWKTVNWTFDRIQERMGLNIAVKPGKGKIYFDDFVIETQ